MVSRGKRFGNKARETYAKGLAHEKPKNPGHSLRIGIEALFAITVESLLPGALCCLERRFKKTPPGNMLGENSRTLKRSSTGSREQV